MPICSRPPDCSACEMPDTGMTPGRLMRAVIAIPVRIFQGLPSSSRQMQEILGSSLNTIHNLRYYQRVMAGLREAIEQGD